MGKKILAAADFVKQKYYLEAEFGALPQEIKEEVKIICVTLAEKLRCTFLMGFYEDGAVYFETVQGEDDFDFDEIGAALEIKELGRRKKDFIEALSLWFVMFFTKEGVGYQQQAKDSSEKG